MDTLHKSLRTLCQTWIVLQSSSPSPEWQQRRSQTFSVSAHSQRFRAELSAVPPSLAARLQQWWICLWAQTLQAQEWRGSAGRWKPTLAALHLRHSSGTDGARLVWEPNRGRVPAKSRRWFTPRLRKRRPELVVEGGGRGFFCAADLCWSQGHPPVGKNVGEEGEHNKWGDGPRGLASSCGPPGQLQDLCSMCARSAARWSRDETKSLQSLTEAALCLLQNTIHVQAPQLHPLLF